MPGIPPNAVRIAPGVYDDGVGGLHLAVDELLAAHGYADTPENRRMIVNAARERLAGKVPRLEIDECLKDYE